MLSCVGAESRAAERSIYEIAPATMSSAILFSSDFLEYAKSSRTMTLEGNVKLMDYPWIIRSGELVLDMDSETFVSTVPVGIENEEAAVDAGAGSYCHATGRGEFSGGEGTLAPWHFAFDKLSLKDGRYRLSGARLSSCGFHPPDYHIAASRAAIYPGNWMQSWNNVFFLGRVPVFYSPYWRRSLSENPRVGQEFYFGQDQRNGNMVKTDTAIRIAPHVYDRLYLDYFSLQGFGVGDEVDYDEQDAYRGTLYAYRIHETSSDKDRWTLAADHWQKLSTLYSTQWRVTTMSDPDYNNAYFRSNSIRIAPELDNSAALVRQTTLTTARLSYARVDTRDPLNPAKFKKSSESEPRLDFNTANFKIPGLPFLNQASGFADNAFDSSRNYTQRTVNGTWNLTDRYRLWRRVTFSPAAGLSEQYQDRSDSFSPSGQPQTQRNLLNTRYFTTADVRFRTLAGDMDLTHRYTRRLQTNSVKDDLTASDRGEEQNIVSAENFFQPTPEARLILTSGYDLRRTPLGALQPPTFYDRLQPITADLALRPWKKVSLTARETCKVGMGHQSVTAGADYGQSGENHIGAGISQVAFDRQRFNASTTLGLWRLPGGWDMEATLRYLVNDARFLRTFGAHTFILSTSDVDLRKRWHDFTARLGFLSRPGGVREFDVNVELRVGPSAEERIRRAAWEAEWYPWRQGSLGHR